MATTEKPAPPVTPATEPVCPTCGNERWGEYLVGECDTVVGPCAECNAAGDAFEDEYREYMRYVVTGGI